MIEIKGDWIGYYTYDNGYTDSDKLKRVPFRMTIERGISEFVGNIVEEVEYGGIEDEIVIRGRQNDDEIEFTKYYTMEHYLDENGETVSIESSTPSSVYYKGSFDDADRRFKGKWEIPLLREDDDGILHEDIFSGYWFLWREA